MIDRDIKKWCPNNKIDDDPIYRQAAMLVKARADFHYMVPFYDMFNHISDSTKYNIAHKSTPYGPVKRSGYEIITTRKIHKSEELYNFQGEAWQNYQCKLDFQLVSKLCG